jgi:hypothetical protein
VDQSSCCSMIRAADGDARRMCASQSVSLDSNDFICNRIGWGAYTSFALQKIALHGK